MKNPPHLGFSVHVDSLEAYGVERDRRGQGTWCIAVSAESSSEREGRPLNNPLTTDSTYPSIIHFV